MLKRNIPMLFPTDLDASVTFYTRVLGFVEADRGDDFVELQSGEMALWLHSDTQIEDEDFRATLHEHTRGIGLTLNFEVDNVDKYLERTVEKGGAPLEQEPSNTPWGTRKFTIRDPDGYHLSFFSYR